MMQAGNFEQYMSECSRFIFSMRWLSYVHFVWLVFLGTESMAQKTQVYAEAEFTFRQGVELYSGRNYAAARACFDRVSQMPGGTIHPDLSLSLLGVRTADAGRVTFRQHLDYLIAACAVYTESPDALRLIRLFEEQYSDHFLRRHLLFLKGQLMFQDNRYSEAIAVFRLVSESELSPEEQAAFSFQYAYCLFVKKQFAEAMPLFKKAREGNGKYVYPAGYYYAYICFQLKEYDKALVAFERIQDSKMYASVIPYYISQIYFLKGNEGKVLEVVEEAIRRPEVKYKVEMNFLRARVYVRQKKFIDAIPLFEEYVKIQGKVLPGELFLLAYALYNERRFAEAVKHFEQIILSDDSIRSRAFYYMADCYLQSGQKDKARLAFQSAYTLDPDKRQREISLFHFAKLCVDSRQFADAISALERYIQTYPQGIYTEEVSVLLSSSLLQTKDYDRAYDILTKLDFRSPVLLEAWQKVTCYRAVRLMAEKDWPSALDMLQKSLANPFAKDVHALASYLEGEVYFEMKKYSSAVMSYLRFLELYTSSGEAVKSVSAYRAYYNLGFCRYKLKEYNEAARYFELGLIEFRKTDDAEAKKVLQPDLILHLADCRFVTKDYEEAIRHYGDIITNNGKQTDYAFFQIGIIQGLRGRNKEKIASLSRLLEYNPQSIYAADAHFEMAETYFEESELADALLYYQRVIRQFPQSRRVPDALVKTGLVNYNADRKSVALEDFQKVVEKFPGSSQSREALSMLRQIWIEMGQADAYFNYAEKIPGLSLDVTSKDSLSYESLEKAWQEGGCEKALSLMDQYIRRFPSGIFIAEVRWAHAGCLIKSDDYNAALADWEDIIRERRTRYYEQSLLKASSVCYYDLKNYEKAFTYYRLLQDVASTPQNISLAHLGVCRSAYRSEKWDMVVSSANQILNGSIARPSEEQEIRFILAEGFRNLGKPEEAMAAYRRVGFQPVTERAAEAAYRVAEMFFDRQDFRSSMDSCFVIKERFSSYPYWVVKTYILIGRNHDRLGNSFQAQATLESIVNQYNGSDELVEVARRELEAIRARELQKSVVQPPLPESELQMDSTGIK